LDLIKIIKLSKYVAYKLFYLSGKNEDVSQEVAYKLWLTVRQAEAKGSLISFKILKLKAISVASRYIRKQRGITNIEESQIIQKEVGISKEEKELLWFILKKLNKTERLIIILRFGIGGVARRTLDEIATEMNCGITKIFKIEKRTIKKMRKLYRHYDNDYVGL